MRDCRSLFASIFGREDLGEAIIDGLVLSFGTIAMTLVLEAFSMHTVRGVRKQRKGAELYRRGWLYNVVNHVMIGIPLYVFAAMVLCSKEPSRSQMKEWLDVTWVLATHSIQYFFAHKAFHEYPVLYRTFHRFHHRYNVYTPPSSANAVTPGEYLVAYINPFLLPLLLRPVSIYAFEMAICIISLFNLLVHTPRLEAVSKKFVPIFLVSTNNHLDHHRKLNSHYASPTFNVDSILEALLK